MDEKNTVELIAPAGDAATVAADVTEFIDRLPTRDQEIARALLGGVTPGRVAQRYGMRKAELLAVARRIFEPLAVELEIHGAERVMNLGEVDIDGVGHWVLPGHPFRGLPLGK